MPQREFAEFTEPKTGVVWKVDISFLTSRWGCIFGQGCPGVYPAGSGKATTDGGCCTHGVYLDDEAEIRRVRALAKKLSPKDWQLRDIGMSEGFLVKGTKEHGPMKTRVHKGICIFANREGFEGGIGCAFHHYALRTGQHPSDVKPHACWMVPMRDDEIAWDEDGNATKMIITDYRLKDWGEGVRFTWYCIDQPEAFGHPEGMVYRTQEYELRKICGDDVYGQIASHIEKRLRQKRTVPIPLHPTQRKREALPKP